MKSTSLVSVLYYIAALFDGVLGLAFLFAGPELFAAFGIPPLENWGYLQFSAALLIVFGLMFLAVARAPVANRNLIPYGMLLKLSFCSVAFYHWATVGVEDVWKQIAFVDLAFLALFFWSYRAIGKMVEAAGSEVGDRA